jgi:hypothetical protein
VAKDVTISEAIKQLRTQLEEAQQQLAQRQGSGDKGLHFLTKSVELELAVVLKAETEAGFGFKWFLDTSVKAKDADERTHKVKLVLEPKGPGGEPVEVSDTEHERE